MHLASIKLQRVNYIYFMLTAQCSGCCWQWSYSRKAICWFLITQLLVEGLALDFYLFSKLFNRLCILEVEKITYLNII